MSTINMYNNVITARKRSCGKVMLLQVSVILSTRGGGALSRGGAWWIPPRTATAAGGTHPTGMHSCYSKNIHLHKKDIN